MKNDFKHKVVVITGATGGIGRALSWRFAKAGARIVLLDLDAEQLSALQNQVERSGTDVLSLECDVTDFDRCQEAMEQVCDHFGGIDVLINNAGITHLSSFVETDMKVMRRVMEVNYFGAIHSTKAALPSLIERKGMLITTSSMAGLAPMALRSAYSASKHALHGLFDTIWTELADAGIHVMMVCPSTTDTNLRKSALTGDGETVAAPAQAQAAVSPGDVAESVFDGAVKNKRLVVHSTLSGKNWFFWRFFPSLFERDVYRRVQGQRSG